MVLLLLALDKHVLTAIDMQDETIRKHTIRACRKLSGDPLGDEMRSNGLNELSCNT